MPRVLHPPPEDSPPEDTAAALMDAIRTYAAGTTLGAHLSAQQRAIGAHHLAVTAERAFNTALAVAHDEPDVSWPMLSRAHGMAISSLQRRVARADPGGPS